MASHSTGPVPDHVQQTIQDIEETNRKYELEMIEGQTLINQLLAKYGQPPRYTNIASASAAQTGMRGDEYFGQPLQSVVKDVLARRRASNLGPATINELHKAMLAGGYQFEAKDEANAKRGLRVSLSKNSAAFIKLPNGGYGLREWYPNAKEPKARQQQPDETPDKEEAEEAAFDFNQKEEAMKNSA